MLVEVSLDVEPQAGLWEAGMFILASQHWLCSSQGVITPAERGPHK